MSTYLVTTLLVLILGIGLLAWFEFRPIEHSAPEGAGAALPEAGFSHTDFEALLLQFVDAQGQVDYQRWHQDTHAVAQLNGYLKLIAQVSPENAPERFPEKEQQMVFWIQAYNALVIAAVLQRWPLESVLEVSAPIEVITGLGFFYKQRYLVGGNYYSLYAIEHEKVIAPNKDPRIHFVLNCASGGCPAIRSQLPSGPALEALLESAAHDFINNPENIRYDEQKGSFIVSKIFEWYRSEFLAAVVQRDSQVAASLQQYFQPYADEGLAKSLKQHPQAKIEFKEYDWSINKVQRDQSLHE